LIRRNLVDLLAFRDDAHVATWCEHQIDGYVWETFSYTWEGEAHTPAEMVEKVGEYRHYDEADYTAAYEELVKRGWAEEYDGRYELTDKGKETRQKTEDLTNEYFDTGFDLLSGEEMDELIDLLGKLAEALHLVAEEQ
jgi:DNA-binding MarR family transcriptional regulator